MKLPKPLRLIVRAFHDLCLQVALIRMRLRRLTPYALAGEWVTCERGHKIARLTRDVRYGDPFKSSDLDQWQQQTPPYGTYIDTIKCTQCGAAWVREPSMQFHFRQGWRGV